MSQEADSRPTGEEIEIARFIDAEMSEAEKNGFEQRLAADASLAEAVRQARELRSLFKPGREDAGLEPTPEFKSRVMRDVAKLPSYRDWQDGVLLDLGIWGKRIVAAAIIIIGLSLMVYSGLIGPADSGRLEASTGEIEERIRELDASIKADGEGR
ncbi:MAG: anti-sigma factor [Planctomycetota bacterium]|jgi:anti-sigma factor RsiW